MKKLLQVLLVLLIIASAAGVVMVAWHSGTIIGQMVDVRVEPTISWPLGAAERVQALDVPTEGDIALHAWHLEAPEPQGLVILLHGMHGMAASSMVHFGLPLQEQGYEVFALDMRAHGRSGGDEIGLAYTEVNDVVHLLNWLQTDSNYRELPITLIGHSMGGATAINTAAVRPDVAKVVSISGFASFEETFVDVLRSEAVPEPIVYLYRLGVRLQLWRRYGLNPVVQAPLRQVSAVTQPLLLIHGDADEQIDVRQARMLHSEQPEAELWLIPDGRHDVIQQVFFDEPWRQQLLAFLAR